MLKLGRDLGAGGRQTMPVRPPNTTGHRFTVRRGPRPGVWELSADLSDVRTALRVLERWARQYPEQYAEVEGVAGPFARHLPVKATGSSSLFDLSDTSLK